MLFFSKPACKTVLWLTLELPLLTPPCIMKSENFKKTIVIKVTKADDYIETKINKKSTEGNSTKYRLLKKEEVKPSTSNQLLIEHVIDESKLTTLNDEKTKYLKKKHVYPYNITKDKNASTLNQTKKSKNEEIKLTLRNSSLTSNISIQNNIVSKLDMIVEDLSIYQGE